MKTREHYELFRHLMEQYCQFMEDVEFVESVSGKCKEEGIEEPDREKPLRFVFKSEEGCKLLVREELPEKVMKERLNALSVRNTVLNVASDRTDLLDSDGRKLAYLFLSEYAKTFPDIAHDELLADDWAFGEMEKLGFFQKEKAKA